MTDSQIVELFNGRDENALNEVISKYKNYCIYISKNILFSDEEAEECFNEACLAVWNSIPPQKPENLKAYIGKLVREISISRYRKNSSEKRGSGVKPEALDEIEELYGDCDIDEKISAEEFSRYLSLFIRGLGETERNIFVRRYWFNDSIDNICLRYGFGKSKVKMILKRTRDKLSDKMKKDGYVL